MLILFNEIIDELVTVTLQWRWWKSK